MLAGGWINSQLYSFHQGRGHRPVARQISCTRWGRCRGILSSCGDFYRLGSWKIFWKGSFDRFLKFLSPYPKLLSWCRHACSSPAPETILF